jgi:hypothetical protein
VGRELAVGSGGGEWTQGAGWSGTGVLRGSRDSKMVRPGGDLPCRKGGVGGILGGDEPVNTLAHRAGWRRGRRRVRRRVP